MKTERPVVGFLGAGNVLGAYLGQLDRLVARGLAELGPVCAHSPERRSELAARRPGMPLVSEVGDVVGDPAVDAVVVITPPALHAEHVRIALEAGKHVLCEKPVGEGRGEAELLYRLAADRGLLLLAAPFVQLNPTFRALWTAIEDGAIGRAHSARALYGTAGATWALWFHDGSVGPLAELGIYNLKSLTALLGPVEEIQIAESTAVPTREVDGEHLDEPGHDVQHVILRHAGGALSSLVTGQAIQRYRRPALEIYGTEGTANLLGDDWDSSGYELWRNSAAYWESHDSLDPTWLWCDGLRELAACLREERAPLASSSHDLHLLDVIAASRIASRERRAVAVGSGFDALDLRVAPPGELHHQHDRTRPPDEQ
ncbi:MAG: Gfo/Idh/MocA family oxidoreductase [Actinomycetota bacterium]|nr:Gfo/Idh/MocA family oxidoreductase [Actinomycetota bacterium]